MLSIAKLFMICSFRGFTVLEVKATPESPVKSTIIATDDNLLII